MAEIILIDNYSEKNYNSVYFLSDTSANNLHKPSQSFIGKDGILDSCKFYLSKCGYPTGNAYVEIYAHSGTFGISSLPTGSPLATSDVLDVSTLTTSQQLILFNFSGANKIILTDGIKYIITVNYSNGSYLVNYITVGFDTAGTAAGNGSHYSNTWGWVSNSLYDLCFYVYAEETTPYIAPSEQVISIAKPIKLTTTKEINGAWTASMQILPDDYISTENYVGIDGEDYITKNVKKIKSGGQYYYDVSLYHNMIKLAELTIDKFSLLKSVEDLLDIILADTDWIAGIVDIDEIIFLHTDRRTSVLETLNSLTTLCNGELYFHSKTRVVDLKRQIGTDTKLQLRYDKNCDYIEKEEDSTDLITRIYPYGPDNFTLNTTVLDDCEDETLYIPSGAGTTESSDLKQYGSQGIKINSATLNETFTGIWVWAMLKI